MRAAASRCRLHRLALAACGAASVGVAGPAAQAQPSRADDFELDPVVVTARSADGRLRGVPHGLSVITAADIARSTAVSLGDLLSREAGLNWQSYYGNDLKASVDIRGMGESAGSNVLVMVDGVRLNEDDLSGADLASLSLAQIDRIEVLRGGGTVAYGNGAVGGVINIITRRAQPGPARFDTSLQAGSYGSRNWRAGAAGGVASEAGAWAGGLVLSGQDSGGYRRNSDVHAKDLALDLRWMPVSLAPLSDLFIKASHHQDRSGLPGGVSLEDFKGSEADRRKTYAPEDFSRLEDSRLSAGVHADLERGGRLELQASTRARRNPYVLGGSVGDPSHIESRRHEWQAQYNLDFGAGGRAHSLNLGMQQSQSSYERVDNGGSRQRKTGGVHDAGWFADARLAVASGWHLQAGVRRNRYKAARVGELQQQACDYTWVDIDPGPAVFLLPVQSNCRLVWNQTGNQAGNWVGRAAEWGLSGQVGRGITVFSSFSRHFRNPNIDELAQSAPDLHPQHGRTVEIGARYAAQPGLSLSWTAFQIRNVDEIFFDGAGVGSASQINLNHNYDHPTRRTGQELALDVRPLSSLRVKLNAAWVRPRFEGVDTDIPLVPRHTAGVEVDWAVAPGMQALLAAHYVGSRLQGNDQTGALPKLDDYLICDLGWRQQLGRAGGGKFSLSAGVSNVFNQVYAAMAFSGSYYPMPRRGVHVAATWAY